MLRPQPVGSFPDETACIAYAAFPKRRPYLRLADELGSLFTDETFAALFPSHGQSAFAPWRLALVTILQFAEGLADRPAADAVRSRIDWKYVLRLALSTHVLAAVRALNRLEVVTEAMRQTLNSLAVVAPDWLRQQAPPDWTARYEPRAEDDRLPAANAMREVRALTIGADGYALLAVIDAASAPLRLREVTAVQTLRQAWMRQYQLVEGNV